VKGSRTRKLPSGLAQVRRRLGSTALLPPPSCAALRPARIAGIDLLGGGRRFAGVARRLPAMRRPRSSTRCPTPVGADKHVLRVLGGTTRSLVGRGRRRGRRPRTGYLRGRARQVMVDDERFDPIVDTLAALARHDQPVHDALGTKSPTSGPSPSARSGRPSHEGRHRDQDKTALANAAQRRRSTHAGAIAISTPVGRK